VKIAAPPPSILPKTMASPSLLAYLMASKFVDGLPLYRITRQLERLGGVETEAGQIRADYDGVQTMGR
jgi:transposase